MNGFFPVDGLWSDESFGVPVFDSRGPNGAGAGCSSYRETLASVTPGPPDPGTGESQQHRRRRLGGPELAFFVEFRSDFTPHPLSKAAAELRVRESQAGP